MKLTIDFEVRSPVDIKKAGAWKYAEHPDTTPLCLAMKGGLAKPRIWINPLVSPFHDQETDFEWRDTPDWFLDKIGQADIIEAHNAEFEKAIWRSIMVPRYGWPDIPDALWRCSAAKASAHALPRSLEGAGAALGLAIKKDMDGHRLMMKMCRPRKPRKGEPEGLYWHEDPEDFLKLFRYCLQDVEAEHAISEALDDLNPMEQKVWFLDQKMNERGILADIDSAKKIVGALAKYEAVLTSELQDISAGKIQTKNQVKVIAEYCGCASLTKDHVAETLETELTPDVRRILEIRQLIGKASTGKFDAMISRACDDNRLRGHSIYHGATTGRWTNLGVQLQNLIRKSVQEEDFDLALSLLLNLDTTWMHNLFGVKDPVEMAQYLIRPMLTSGKGKYLFCADFAQIEARVLLWLAGETEALELFRSGKEDPYCVMASEIYERHITKADKTERQVGKTARLGLGFGMGWKKFKNTCKTQAGVEIDRKLSQKAVKIFRKGNPKVPALWYATEGAAIKAVQTGERVECGKTTWERRGKFLQCILPSGRRLSYPDPLLKIVPAYVFPALDDERKETSILIVGENRDQARKKAHARAKEEESTITGPPIERKRTVLSNMGIDTKTKKWVRENTYGGLLVENETQATARDLMAGGMLRAEDRGYKVLLSVHDEVLAEAISGSVEEFERIMVELPAWAEGCPVAAEGWRGRRYRK